MHTKTHTTAASRKTRLALNAVMAALLGLGTAAPTLSQVQERPLDARAQNPAQVDPPGRVGRLAELTGQVWLWSPDSGEWVGAQRNRPLTSGDRLASDANSRAEVNIGSTTVRLDARMTCAQDAASRHGPNASPPKSSMSVPSTSEKMST